MLIDLRVDDIQSLSQERVIPSIAAGCTLHQPCGEDHDHIGAQTFVRLSMDQLLKIMLVPLNII